MLYFTHQELAYTYHVSVKTVRNWVDAAKQGKLGLELYDHGGRQYVANTAVNIEIIKELANKGKKYRNRSFVKEAEPRAEFYQIFSPAQAYDILTSLELQHEVPHQYSYFGQSAEFWDLYAHRLAEEKTPNLLTSTLKLLDVNQPYLDDLLSKYKRVNVVDVGVGNALPVKDFLQHLLNQGKLGRYLAIDVSPEMLEIAGRNIKDWFGGKVEFEGYEQDINYDRFNTLLAEEALKRNAHETVNLVLFLGGTPENLPDQEAAYRIIRSSMGGNDLFIQVVKLDTPAARQYFDFGIDSKPQPLPEQEKFLIDLLGIDESYYDVEMGYDSEVRARYMRIRLKYAVTIRFKFDEGERLINLNKDDRILLWRYWHQDGLEVVQQLQHVNFLTLQSSLTEDEEYLLTVSRLKRN